MINDKIVKNILKVAPKGAQCCYTGQSSLAAVPDPTFEWEEVESWSDATDIDLFCYNVPTMVALIQRYLDAGWQPTTSIEQFKCNRIRFAEPTRKFSIQTVKLRSFDETPELNITWKKNCASALDVIRSFDMDYVMCAYDLHAQAWADMRPKDKRVAHVNKLNPRFDPYEVEPSWWYRQFDRLPKGWNRGIDTRPVAEQYVQWIDQSIALGDKTINSKTRAYREREMNDDIDRLVQGGLERCQAEAVYRLAKGELPTWENSLAKHEAMRKRIVSWLESVAD